MRTFDVMLTLRSMQNRDLPQLLALYQQYGHAEPPLTLDGGDRTCWSDLAQNRNNHYFVGEYNLKLSPAAF